MRTNRRASLLLSLVAPAITLATTASAQIAAGPYTLDLQPVASALTSPTQITHAGDGSGRLFIVDQIGKVWIIHNGAALPTPFLDLTSVIVSVNPGFDERGLLGIAFHPQYAANGRFFVRYSKARTGIVGEPCFGTSRGCHEEILAEYHVSPADPNLADPASGVILFRVDKPQFNHNGGGIKFGPDGFLYFSLGDGGGANDGLADVPPSHGPIGNAQNLGVKLGKVHRIDVTTPPPGAYVIPPGNPFIATPGAVPEIYAYGLRNPYAFSFDDAPGGDNRLIIADVGQNLFEEINIGVAGGNYGWVIREGLHCFDPFAPTTPPAACAGGFIDPVAEYAHTENAVTNGISIIGGFIYRGQRLPGLNGLYVFGDFSTSFGAPDGKLLTCDLAQPAPAPITRLKIGGTDAPLGRFVKGFGRDAAGEVYVAVSTILGPTGVSGQVFKLAPCKADFNGSATITVQDIFDFLAAYFLDDPRADINGAGGVSVQDIFDYLNAYFSGC